MVYGYGYSGKLNEELAICVYTDDIYKVPHSHVCNDERIFNVCICIDMADYLPHGDINDVLDAEQKRQLTSFFESEDKFGENHWALLLKTWERNNPDICVDIHTHMLNYLNLTFC